MGEPNIGNQSVVPTFSATIYVGFREGRSDVDDATICTIEDARKICQGYCDVQGLCVTLTPTEFIYTNGSEPGVIVGLINYPRFPKPHELIKATALELAERLRVHLRQFRVTVVMPGETVMLGDEPTRPTYS